MKLFENYSKGISGLLETSNFQAQTNLSSNVLPHYFEKGLVNESIVAQRSNPNNKVLIEFNKNELTSLFGENKYSFQETRIGTHPDFENIEHSQFEKHFCVSMFMDIKGSTRLIEKYKLEEIRRIKDTILTLAIQVATHFGGHIHRLQGDGIFIQFVRRDQAEQDAVINALNTASILTHFISNDLAQLFVEQGVRPLSVRTGIDLGYKEDVIWSHYGVPGCSELTTTSLHTDLAAKLQSKSSSNGILVGNNIQQILDIKPEFCQDVLDNENKTDYYIYEGIKNYRKFQFNWINYLKSFDFAKLHSSGKKIEIEIPTIRIECLVQKPNGESYMYNQNSSAIPKDCLITYTLKEYGRDYVKREYETIEWTAFNSGQEAKKDQQETHDFGGIGRNKIICSTSSKFTGHHYVQCSIKRPHSDNVKIQLPIYVK